MKMLLEYKVLWFFLLGGMMKNQMSNSLFDKNVEETKAYSIVWDKHH